MTYLPFLFLLPCAKEPPLCKDLQHRAEEGKEDGRAWIQHSLKQVWILYTQILFAQKKNRSLLRIFFCSGHSFERTRRRRQSAPAAATTAGATVTQAGKGGKMSIWVRGGVATDAFIAYVHTLKRKEEGVINYYFQT